MQNWLKENWFKVGLLGLGLLLVVSLPSQGNKQIQEAEKQLSEQEEKQNALDDCLAAADWQHLSIFERLSRVGNSEQWEDVPVIINFYTILGDTDSQKAENLELWQWTRNECFKRYPQT